MVILHEIETISRRNFSNGHYQKKTSLTSLFCFFYIFIYLFLRQIPRGKYLNSPHASYGPDRDADWFTGI